MNSLPRQAQDYEYDAFISYSHSHDSRVALAVQRMLKRIGKPWYQLQAMRVFRDQTNLQASKDAWGTIKSALNRSKYLVLLASPSAAKSVWVSREVEHWMKTKPTERIIIVVTEGEIGWGDKTPGGNVEQDFDWSVTNCLPSCLKRQITQEPLWVDMRWSRNMKSLGRRTPQFTQACARIVARIKDEDLSAVINEDATNLRRTRTAVATAAVLLIALGLGLWLQYLRANEERQHSLANLAATYASYAQSAEDQGDLDEALVFYAQAYETDPSPVYLPPLLHALSVHEAHSVLSQPQLFQLQSGWATYTDGGVLVGPKEDGIGIWDMTSGELRQTIQLSVVHQSRPFTVNRAGTHLASVTLPLSDQLSVWQLADGIESRIDTDSPELVRALCFDAEARHLAFVRSDARVLIYDTKTGTELANRSLLEWMELPPKSAAELDGQISQLLGQMHTVSGAGVIHLILPSIGRLSWSTDERDWSKDRVVPHEAVPHNSERIYSAASPRGRYLATAYPVDDEEETKGQAYQVLVWDFDLKRYTESSLLRDADPYLVDLIDYSKDLEPNNEFEPVPYDPIQAPEIGIAVDETGRPIVVGKFHGIYTPMSGQMKISGEIDLEIGLISYESLHFEEGIMSLQAIPTGTLLDFSQPQPSRIRRWNYADKRFIVDHNTLDIVTVDVSPDGKTIACNRGDHVLELINTFDKSTTTLATHPDASVSVIRFNPIDPDRLFIGYTDGRCELLSIEDGLPIWEADLELDIRLANWSPTGDRVAIVDGPLSSFVNQQSTPLSMQNVLLRLHVLDADDGMFLTTRVTAPQAPAFGEILDLDFTTDGRLVLATSSNEVVLTDQTARRVEDVLPSNAGSGKPLAGIRIAPDDRSLYIFYHTGEIEVIDLFQQDANKQLMLIDQPIRDVELLPSGLLIIATDQHFSSSLLFNKTSFGTADTVSGIAGGEIILASAGNGRILGRASLDDLGLVHMSVRPYSDAVAVGRDGTLRAWDWRMRAASVDRLTPLLTNTVLDYSSNGRFALSSGSLNGGPQLVLAELTSGRVVWQSPETPPPHLLYDVGLLSGRFSANGQAAIISYQIDDSAAEIALLAVENPSVEHTVRVDTERYGQVQAVGFAGSSGRVWAQTPSSYLVFDLDRENPLIAEDTNEGDWFVLATSSDGLRYAYGGGSLGVRVRSLEEPGGTEIQIGDGRYLGVISGHDEIIFDEGYSGKLVAYSMAGEKRTLCEVPYTTVALAYIEEQLDVAILITERELLLWHIRDNLVLFRTDFSASILCQIKPTQGQTVSIGDSVTGRYIEFDYGRILAQYQTIKQLQEKNAVDELASALTGLQIIEEEVVALSSEVSARSFLSNAVSGLKDARSKRINQRAADFLTARRLEVDRQAESRLSTALYAWHENPFAEYGLRLGRWREWWNMPPGRLHRMIQGMQAIDPGGPILEAAGAMAAAHKRPSDIIGRASSEIEKLWDDPINGYDTFSLDADINEICEIYWALAGCRASLWLNRPDQLAEYIDKLPYYTAAYYLPYQEMSQYATDLFNSGRYKNAEQCLSLILEAGLTGPDIMQKNEILNKMLDQSGIMANYSSRVRDRPALIYLDYGDDPSHPQLVNGDIIQSINERPVGYRLMSPDIFRTLLVPGARVVIDRDGERLIVDLQQPLQWTPDSALYWLYKQTQSFAGVNGVTQGSFAQKVNIRPGDFLLQVNGEPVSSQAEVHEIIRDNSIVSLRFGRIQTDPEGRLIPAGPLSNASNEIARWSAQQWEVEYRRDEGPIGIGITHFHLGIYNSE